MNTKVIFNTNKTLKDKAMRKARKQGTTLTSVLNFATQAYVDDRFEVDVVGQMIEKAREEIRQGKGISQEEVFKRLGL